MNASNFARNTALLALIAFSVLFSECGAYGTDHDIRFEHALTLGVQICDFAEDKEGFFWIATNAGLVRYDGTGTKTWRKGPDSIS